MPFARIARCVSRLLEEFREGDDLIAENEIVVGDGSVLRVLSAEKRAA